MASLMTSRRALAAGTALTAALGAGVWLAAARPHRPAPRLVYVAAGYGGLVAAPPAPPPAARGTRPARPAVTTGAASAEGAAVAAYVAGRYAAVEAASARVIRLARQRPTLPNRRAAARARSLLAYAAARRHDLALARARFAAAEQSAQALPDHGIQAAGVGQDPKPSLAEDAAFQRAVCTAALGDKAGAEAQYCAFMRAHPESPLVMAALKRLQRMHGGDAPPADEAVWRRATATARARQDARLAAASVCGPECLAELLRRRGEAADVRRLAAAMGTGDRGTSLAALASAAGRRGFAPRGLSLTLRGLGEQALPVIALVAPGHYVLVDAVTARQVTVWDPDGRGVGRPQVRAVPAAAWAGEWQGVTLALRPAATKPIQTAQR